MRTGKLTGAVLLVLLASIYVGHDFSLEAAQKENHCFTCHTNARTLIQITRDIAKSRKGVPGASAETKGEG